MRARFSFSFFSCCYLLLLVALATLFQLCLSNNNFAAEVLCLDGERQALLEFKRGLIDKADKLASWVGEERDCCRWTGVVCDNSTGHVRKILLPGPDADCYDPVWGFIENGEASKQRLRGSLSPSLLHLKQLEHLDLSCNDFKSIQIPEFISSLENLRYLNLSNSGFGGIIPPQLGNLSGLQVLCIGNQYTSVMNMQWLLSLRMLRHLDMSGVNLGTAFDWFQVINSLSSLVELYLSNNHIPVLYPHVDSLNLTSVSLLDISYNQLNPLLMPWIFSITSLVSLDISECYFHGPVPSSVDIFRNLTSLEFLHASSNDFMNSSLVLEGLSNIGGNLILLDISSCGVSSSALDSLQNLTSLRSLDLSRNQLTKRIPKSLGYNLCNLRDLDLSENKISNISSTYLLESFLKCKSPALESLNLWYMGLSGTIPDSIGRLSFLRSLHLGENLISGTIPDSIGWLPFLRSLDLGENLLSGSIPSSIERLSSLEALDLSYNRLSGGLPHSIGRLSSLKELHLSNNQLDGNLPFSIKGLSSLEVLDFSNNLVNGGLPNSLGHLSKLRELSFPFNLLTGVVTEAHFSKLVNLKELHGEGNNITLVLRLSNWIPPFQLKKLVLNSWILGPQFPLWLQSQKILYLLHMSNTRIYAPMPPESFWRSLPSLLYLDLSQNHLQEALLNIPATVSAIYLSSNKFNGELPDLSNGSYPYLLDLSNNSFEGSLRHFLCPYSVQSTKVLKLGHNNLTGVIPECWEKWPELLILNLENNNLSGGIPRTLGFSYNLQSLNMYGNKLSGKIPASLMNLTNSVFLQLGGNELVGNIPSWLGTKLSFLRLINLRSNNFDGNIPHELCYLTYIQILDFAHNNLYGDIPRCFNNFTFLSGKEVASDNPFRYRGVLISEPVISSDSLVLKGREDTYDTILPLVMLLDLSNNNICGNIPSELTALKALRSLNLSKNQLTGSIPKKIGDMNLLESLDLSMNMLSGELPVSLSSLNFLSSFNVSYNSLTGRIPSSTQLQSLPKWCFFNNKLCGDPLQPCAVESHDREEDVSHGTDWWMIISIVLGFFVGFWIILAPLIVSRTWRIAYFHFLRDLGYKIYDVMQKYSFKIFSK